MSWQVRQFVQFAGSVLVLLTTSPLLAQPIATRPNLEALTLDLDSAVLKRLANVEDFIADKQWDLVASLLRQTPAEKPDKLVPLAPGWYVSVARYCQCQAALLPPAGLAAYRRQAEATANKWLNDAERLSPADPARQRAAWLRIVRHAFASSAAEKALARLAEQSFERGDFAAARTNWELLLPASGALRTVAGLGLLRHPDSSHDDAQVRAQLVLCSLCEGDAVRAAQELAAFRRWHGDATGRLAGRDGILIELLSEYSQNRSAQTSAEFAERSLDRRRWEVTLPIPTAALEIEGVVPVIVGNTLFATNGEAVFAFDSETGRPKWSEDSDEAGAAMIYSLADPVPPKLPINGRVWHSLTIQEDRLYARLGTPITGKAKLETNSHSELVGLDIGIGEGKLVWRVAAEHIDRQDPLSAAAPWCFEGAPVADSERVFVALRRSLPQEQLNVACFDAETARLLWNRKIGITVAATEEAVNTTSHLQLTLAEDSVFLATDAGAVAALDVQDGAIRWLRTYASENVLSSPDRRRNGHTPPIYHDGVLYVAPLDTDLLMAIHAESGLLLWQREWPDPIQQVLGVCDGTLIVQGRSLWGVDLATGDPAWPHRRVGHDDPEGSSFGRGVLIDQEVWWPNREELIVVSANSGRITRRQELKESLGLSGGHLATFGKSLALSRSGQLTVLGELRPKSKIDP
ncbi:MAG: PQQ-binding-like beta-propeller repeat protein [Planctomycetaceae bacterium]